MEITYQRTPRQSYMLISGQPHSMGYEATMIRENHIHCLLSWQYTQLNGISQFHYDITGKKALRDFFEQEGTTATAISSFFQALERAAESLEKYLIGLDEILFSIDTVYMEKDGDAWKIGLCYYPSDHVTCMEGMQEIVEYLMQHVGRDQLEDLKLCYDLYDVISQTTATLTDIVSIVEKSTKQAHLCSDVLETSYEDSFYDTDDTSLSDANEVSFLQDDLTEADNPKESIFQRVFRLSKTKAKTVPSRVKKKKKELFPSNMPEDFIYDPIDFEQPEEGTTYLSFEKCTQGKLVYKGYGQGEDLLIVKTPFRIGSRPEQNEGVIALSVISRYHAKITCENGIYYIEDLHSKNGTYVNGEILNYRQPMMLKSGDMVSFADIPYVFI